MDKNMLWFEIFHNLKFSDQFDFAFSLFNVHYYII